MESPLFLDQLVAALRAGGNSTRAIDRSAGQHGHDLLLKGFTVSQVVHDYGDVCQSITELAVETNAPISTDDSRMLNCCLDEAIASAVTIYQRESQRAHSEVAAEHGNERIGFLVHELRNLVNTATVAFEVLQTGNVGVGGSTGGVLNRSLQGLRDLIARSLEDVRLTQRVSNRKHIGVGAFIEEVGAAATLAATARGITLIVEPVQDGLTIDGDQQVLGAVLGNLLQNAVKFTRPDSTVTLRVGATTDRILIEVHDECGGLPGDNATELLPSFEQQSADRTGLGIGLAFSRWGGEANGGRLYARNLPEKKGCVFTIDLPRVAAPAAELAVTAEL